MKRGICAIFLFLLPACNQASEAVPTAASAAPAQDGWKSYGAALGDGPHATVAAILAAPKSYEGKRLRIDGTVRRACAQKGCWMELSDNRGEKAAGCRVTFKDYGFFVPKDSAGAQARMDAVVEVELVKKSHVEHMEAEGASFEHKNPDGTAHEVRLVASGVQLKK
jgi:hypothetical protein